MPPGGDRVDCVQLGDAAVLDHHRGEVRASEPPEHVLLSVRLSVGRQLNKAGLEDVRRGGLYMAPWRSGAHSWRLEHGIRPLTPEAPGSHAVVVAMHPEGMEAMFGEDGTNHLSLAVNGAVLVPTSISYRLVNRGGDPRVLVVVGTRQEADTGHRGPEQCAVEVEETERRAHRRAMRVGPREMMLRGPQRRGDKRNGVRTRAGPRAMRWTSRPTWRRPLRRSWRRPARRLLKRWKKTTKAGSVAKWGKLMRRVKDSTWWGRGRRTRWSTGRRRWRTELGPRRGSWKPAGTGPRGGACGRMHAA